MADKLGKSCIAVRVIPLALCAAGEWPAGFSPPSPTFHVFIRLRTLSFPYLPPLGKQRGVFTNNSHFGSQRSSRITISFCFTLFCTLLHSFAFFALAQKLNSFLFKQFLSLCEKHPVWGTTLLRATTRSRGPLGTAFNSAGAAGTSRKTRESPVTNRRSYATLNRWEFCGGLDAGWEQTNQ